MNLVMKVRIILSIMISVMMNILVSVTEATVRPPQNCPENHFVSASHKIANFHTV